MLLAVLWALANYASYENVRALGTVVQLADAAFLADPTFLLGSALVVSRPLTLAAVLAATVAAAWWGARTTDPAPAAPWAIAGGTAVALLGVVVAWPPSDAVAYWRQVHFVEHNLKHGLPEAGADDDGLARFPDPPSAMLDRLPSMRADVSGAPRIPIRASDRPRNVLLVVVESLSGSHVASVAAAHGYETPHRLETVDRLAREGFTLTTFVAHNRKTNRGEYALLCGELPNLLAGEPKMSAHTAGGWQRCLPQVLRDAGYATVYLQAAPLPFMLKDQFMPVAGFERVLGDADLETVRWRTHWGVDDRSLFEHALRVVAELQRGDRPWFLTVLTAGTHHPYTVPEDFDALRDDPDARALAYADQALGAFFAGLERDGVLDDALVLVTSDESMGLATAEDGALSPLSTTLAENWGVLIALVPGAEPVAVDEPYGQMDVAISVLDYLDLADRGGHFLGRSVFRRYPEPRWTFFANTNHLTLGAIDPFRRLLVCRAGEPVCRKYRAPGGRVFGPALQQIAVDPNDAILPEMARRSVHRERRDGRRRTVRLVASDAATLASGARKVLFGGQYLDLRPGEWLELDLEIDARGRSGGVRIVHYTKQTRTWAADRPPGPGRMLVERELELAAGETLSLHYDLAPDGGMQGIQTRATATNVGDDPIELVFREASLTKRFVGDRPRDEVAIEREEISRTGR